MSKSGDSNIGVVRVAGLMTTAQDGGRPGYRHLGVPRSGAADSLSFALANLAVGNAWNMPALECTATGPQIQFTSTASIALAGADMNATLNGSPVARFKKMDVFAGDDLQLGSARFGMRAYLAFAGGIIAGETLGSVSTHFAAGLGGYDGRNLTAGDVIKAGASTSGPGVNVSAMAPSFSNDWVLRATDGSETSQVGADVMAKFFSAKYAASADANRMGLRLSGPSLVPPCAGAMASSPVFPGTVQLPPSGSPIILLNDAQTVGGYPRIAQIIDADISMTGQIRPRDNIWFRRVSADDARNISIQRAALLKAMLGVAGVI